MQTFGFSSHKLSVSESTGRGENYNYDAIYRLLNENITGGPSNGSLGYGLDAVGNRTSLTSTLAELQSQTASYDADDRISGDTFDANGNTLTSNGVTYGYEFEDRSVSTSTGVQIVYDGDGNRVSETVGEITTKFLVDEHNPTRYAQVAEEIVNGAVAAQYTYGVMRISQNRAATVSYYGYDGGGSVRQLLNTAGVVTDTYAYDAFGSIVARTGSTVNTYQYRGEQFDAALGMYYLRARYYVPKTGRFLTSDKYEGCCCTPSASEAAHHSYLYADGDPVNLVDPTGRTRSHQLRDEISCGDKGVDRRGANGGKGGLCSAILSRTAALRRRLSRVFRKHARCGPVSTCFVAWRAYHRSRGSRS